MITATSQTLHDGNKNVVMQFTGVCDGLGADELQVKKVDCAGLRPVPPTVKIWKINYDVSGGILELLWDANDPVSFLDLTGRNTINYDKIGGLRNAFALGYTGNVLFSTRGFDLGSSYSVLLEMTKRFP